MKNIEMKKKKIKAQIPSDESKQREKERARVANEP